ncbi:hypothetical protein GGI19_004472, partial [Coemansia pectinata]
MVATSKGARPYSLGGATDVESDYRILAAENFSFSATPGTNYNDVGFLLRNALHRNCGTVWQQAIPRTSDLSTVTREFASEIAMGMEARLSMVAKPKRHNNDFWDFSYAGDCRGKGPNYDYWHKDTDSDTRGKGLTSNPLDAWASDILEWTDFPVPTTSANSQHSDDGDDSDDSEFT